jgi:uncharacterized protein YlxW (UPF0749 family)
MKVRIFFLVCIFYLCVLLAGVYIGDTVGSKRQKAMDDERIQALTEQNLRILERVENLNAVIKNMLGLRRTKDIVIARPGAGD